MEATNREKIFALLNWMAETYPVHRVIELTAEQLARKIKTVDELDFYYNEICKPRRRRIP